MLAAMTVSIVVATRDRPEALGRCLASLSGQADEIVVVDDGSTDEARVAAQVEAAGARLVRLGGSGPAAARNAGSAAARGAVVCFTDDDCEARGGWAAALAAPILAGATAASGGRTEAAASAGAADRAWQAIVDHLQRAGAEPGSPSPGFAPTCNLAASRELLAELRFDESFPGAAGEDRDWAARAAALGSAPRFVGEAVVVHRPDLDARSFLRQQYRYGRGAVRYRAGGNNRRPGAPSFYAALVRNGFSHGPAVGALVLAAQAATVLGVLVERVRA
jgi:glycosyltransferase involved in cell wall biosynthesis